MKQRSTIETMQRLASQMDGLALASRGMRAIRPAKKIVTMPKKVRNVTIDTNDECLYPEYETETEKADCEAEIDYIGSFENSPVEEEIEEAEEIELEVVSIESEEVKQIMEQPIDAIEAEQKTVTKKDGTTTSGYGSETSGDTTDQQLLKQQQMQKEKEQSMTGDDHCVRCHKDCVLIFVRITTSYEIRLRHVSIILKLLCYISYWNWWLNETAVKEMMMMMLALDFIMVWMDDARLIRKAMAARANDWT
jgi:hypothetical protein